jgi:hypothetical protein
MRMYGSGRPRKLTKVILAIIHRKFVKYPTMMAIDLKGFLLELEEIPEQSTKYFEKPEDASRSAAQKPLLTLTMKKKWLAFVKK